MNPNDASYCACANVLCSQYGCQRMRGNQMLIRCQCGLWPHQTCSHTNCIRSRQTYTYPDPPAPNYAEIFTQFQKQQGCICPPGANKDCESPACPRKPLTDAYSRIEVKK